MGIKYVGIAGTAVSAAYIALAVWAAVFAQDFDERFVYAAGCAVLTLGVLIYFIGEMKKFKGYIIGMCPSAVAFLVAISVLMFSSFGPGGILCVLTAVLTAVCAVYLWLSGRKHAAGISAVFFIAVVIASAVFGAGIWIAFVSAVFAIYMEELSWWTRLSKDGKISVPVPEPAGDDSAVHCEKAKPEPVRVTVHVQTEETVPAPPVQRQTDSHGGKTVPPVSKSEPAAAPKRTPDAAAEAPKLRIMSSRDAVAVRDSVSRVKEFEDLNEQQDPEDDGDDPSVSFEETPEVLLRRAAWNRGLRCRKDYGDHRIPIAFVKGKVAVFVGPGGSKPTDGVLEAEGWTVLCYCENDITDGKEQSEEIRKAVKDNIRESSRSKGKRSKK